MYKQLARSAAHSVGIVSFLRRLRTSGVRILMYHRFPADPSGLTRQCEHLVRHYRPVSLGEVADFYHGVSSLPPNAVAVTVDDGYRDFLTNAYPVFRRFGIRPTVFLVSDFLDGRLWLWWDIIAYVLEHTLRPSMRLALPDGSSGHFRLASPEDRLAAHVKICRVLTDAGIEERAGTIAALTTALGVDPPAAPPDGAAPLTWDEVRSLAAEGVEFGAHTRTHANLARIGDPDRLRDEILQPKARIETEIGRPVIHICYPNGRRQDYSQSAVDIVASGGFRTAVTTERGISVAATPRLRLLRLGVEPSLPLDYLDELLVGLRVA